jgi:hypothetical protein
MRVMPRAAASRREVTTPLVWVSTAEGGLCNPERERATRTAG